MGNKKQSSIDWLEECLSIHFTHEQKMQFEGLFQQAKAMHKEEYRLIYEGLLQNVGTSVKQNDLPTFEQYYNEIFKK